jgi:hypothetical protein
MAAEIALTVNDVKIKMVHFVADFTEATVIGMMHGLKGVGEIHDLKLFIDQDTAVIEIDSQEIPLNEYATRIIISTMKGLLEPLTGVILPIKKVDLRLAKVKLKAN